MSEAAQALETVAAFEAQARVARERRAREAIASTGVTALELEILRWVSHGKTNADIATIMGLGNEDTMVKRVQKILDKTGTPTRAAAVSWALRNGVIE